MTFVSISVKSMKTGAFTERGRLQAWGVLYMSKLIHERQALLVFYFLERAKGDLKSTGEGCDWCDRFIALKFTCCLNCGFIIEVLE